MHAKVCKIGGYYSETDLQHSSTGSEARKRRSPEKTERRAPTGSRHDVPRSLLKLLVPRQDARSDPTLPMFCSSVLSKKFVLSFSLSI